MTGYPPWWVGAAALALVAVGFWRAFRRLLGVSGSIEVALEPTTARGNDAVDAKLRADAAATQAALLEATRRAFPDAALSDDAGAAAPELPPATRFTWGTHVALLLGITLGGALGALIHGQLGLVWSLGPTFEHLLAGGWKVVPLLVGGGFLVGFGTAMAGGCTSGHGLCGTSRLQTGSLLASAAFFGTGVAVSFLLQGIAS